jgi:hypothetical protein
MLPIGCRAEGLRRDRCHVGCDRETCPTVIQTTALNLDSAMFRGT